MHFLILKLSFHVIVTFLDAWLTCGLINFFLNESREFIGFFEPPKVLMKTFRQKFWWNVA